MNVNDIESEKPDGDKLELIFKRQTELKDKYHHIEESQGVGYGLIKGLTFDINEIRSQCLLKDLAWRVVEEITEATEALQKGDMVHFREELADALHFLTELCIQVNITPDMIVKGINKPLNKDKFDILFKGRSQEKDPYKPIYYIGLAMNCLKQKPWKKTHILTDEKKFQKLIEYAYYFFCQYLSAYATSDDAFDFYFKKSRVNDFRIKSNY
jgi:phosphoribosyl-ATP pyrophosphohydrolase